MEAIAPITHDASGRVLTIVRPHGGRKTCDFDDIKTLLEVLGLTMTMTDVYRGFVFTITYRVEEPGYIVQYADIPEIITSETRR